MFSMSQLAMYYYNNMCWCISMYYVVLINVAIVGKFYYWLINLDEQAETLAFRIVLSLLIVPIFTYSYPLVMISITASTSLYLLFIYNQILNTKGI